MADPHTPNSDPAARLPVSLQAVVDAVRRERQLRPLLSRLLYHASDAAKRRAVRLAIINRIGRLITSQLNLDEVLQTAIEAICETLHFADLGLLLVDADHPEILVLRARTGKYSAILPKDYRQSIHEGIIGAVARARQHILLNDVTSDPRYIAAPGMNGVCSELAVPVVVGDRLLGVLNVESTRPLNEEDATDLESVADQLGVAIDNAHLFAKAQQTLAQTQLLYETSRRMSTAMDVDEVIDAYLEPIAATRRYVCTVMLYALDAAGQRMASIIRGRWTPQEGLTHLEERLPYTRDAFDALLDAGQTVTIADFRSDPRVSGELRQLQTGNNRPAWAMIPLMARSQRIGLVILSYPFVHQWSEADLQPYQAAAAQLAVAIDSRRQHLLLIERGQRLAVLEERQRLARELHDSVTQHIFSMTLIAQSLAPAWRRDQAEGERRINRLLELSQATLTEMRALLAELHPADDATMPSGAEGAMAGIGQVRQVRRDGLLAALRQHIADTTGDGVHIDLDTTDYTPQPLAQEEALYRIVQEALNNVVKHAYARHVAITLRVGNGSTHLAVRDDGQGYTLEPAVGADRLRSRALGGFGLRIMRERVEALGGRIDVISAPGQGTIVSVRLPQEDERP
jgi:signal transduction histidine kinase/putative methionine-R-sulfoxide reductase with GAF domain